MVPPSLTSEAVYWAAAGSATTRKTRDQASRMVFLLGRALYRPAAAHLEQNCAVVPRAPIAIRIPAPRGGPSRTDHDQRNDFVPPASQPARAWTGEDSVE